MEIEHIKGLVELMVSNDLSRIEIREGDTHILLRRGATVISATPMQTAPLVAPPPIAAPAAPSPAAAPTAASAATPAANETIIKSPMVGTFYAKPDPESPAFVNIGDVVNPNTVVCLVEAMKVFNEIKAECSGRISRMLVSNGQAVEFDQPLFAVAPA
ncbi:MAG: acetyl-CoA carboxylase biotin carboxyl carrier protein [Phycisphaerales bacterium]|nr:acetyl-CoA carboxylase biotin carboxyl carrier protein [Phycisphaerales bacterium]